MRSTTETIGIPESKIPDGEGLMVTSKGRTLRVFRLRGRYLALANSCPHEGGPVCEGTVTGMLDERKSEGWKPRWVKEGEILYCPWHGTAFEIATGESIVREGLCIRSYPVKVEKGTVSISV